MLSSPNLYARMKLICSHIIGVTVATSSTDTYDDKDSETTGPIRVIVNLIISPLIHLRLALLLGIVVLFPTIQITGSSGQTV
jgi:hypothetical protein